MGWSLLLSVVPTESRFEEADNRQWCASTLTCERLTPAKKSGNVGALNVPRTERPTWVIDLFWQQQEWETLPLVAVCWRFATDMLQLGLCVQNHKETSFQGFHWFLMVFRGRQTWANTGPVMWKLLPRETLLTMFTIVDPIYGVESDTGVDAFEDRKNTTLYK